MTKTFNIRQRLIFPVVMKMFKMMINILTQFIILKIPCWVHCTGYSILCSAYILLTHTDNVPFLHSHWECLCSIIPLGVSVLVYVLAGCAFSTSVCLFGHSRNSLSLLEGSRIARDRCVCVCVFEQPNSFFHRYASLLSVWAELDVSAEEVCEELWAPTPSPLLLLAVFITHHH